MSLIGLIIVLTIVGFLVWAIVTFVPMAPGFKRLIVGVAIAICILYVLYALFGGGVADVRVPRVD